MKWFLLASASLVSLLAPMVATGDAVAPSATNVILERGLILDMTSESLSLGDCGDEDSCGGLEFGHTLPGGGGSYAFPHDFCVSTVAHGGPQCGDGPIMTRSIELPLTAVAAAIGEPHSGIGLNTASRSLVITGCGGSVAAAVPLDDETYTRLADS